MVDGTRAAGAAPGRAGGRRWVRYVGELATRLVEIVLVAIGCYAIFGTDDVVTETDYMSLWDLLALCYVLIGVLVARRSRLRARDAGPDRSAPALLRVLAGRRFSFGFTLAASLVGMGAALAVALDAPGSEVGAFLKAAGVVAMILAWMLLHAGYARFYAGTYFRSGAGFAFPDTDTPARVDLLYFAFTIGTTFAASDVNVTTREMRWHVIVHSVLAFFYNAVVLAIAIGILTGR